MAADVNNSGKHGYWVHTKVRNEQSVTGYFILPECTCSMCGYVAGYERERCPHCRALMDAKAPADAETAPAKRRH